MILTVTLNPAVDKTYTTQALIPGQVNRMRSVRNLAGGKGVNVTKILCEYGYPVMAAGFLGGYSGKFIEECLTMQKAECRFTWLKEETRSSINILAEDGYVTEVLEPGPYVEKEELSRFMDSYRQMAGECELVVLSGSVPQGVPEQIYRQLIEAIPGTKVFADTSGRPLAEAIKAAPYLIKPNLREMEFIVGRKLSGIEEIAEAARSLERGGIECVVVSLGRKGFVAVHGGKAVWVKAPGVRTVNTVGCGDSIVASLAMSLCRKEDGMTAVKRAAAISAANASTLDSGDIPMELAEELMDKVEVENISGRSSS